MRYSWDLLVFGCRIEHVKGFGFPFLMLSVAESIAFSIGLVTANNETLNAEELAARQMFFSFCGGF